MSIISRRTILGGVTSAALVRGQRRKTEFRFHSRRRPLDQYLTIAGDADEGMSYLYQEEPFEHARLPDIVLLKLRLPRTDGLAVLGAVKRIRASARRLVAIVVLTAFDDERTKRAAVALGADACFVEPKGAEDSATLSKKIRDLWECLASSAYPVLESIRT